MLLERKSTNLYDKLVTNITAEARATLFHQRTYYLGGFTNQKTKQQIKLVRQYFLTKLVSNGEVTKASLSLSQSIQSRIPGSGKVTRQYCQLITKLS